MGTLLIRNQHPKYLQKNVFLEVPEGGAKGPTIPSRLISLRYAPFADLETPKTKHLILQTRFFHIYVMISSTKLSS